jgi:hypothetical protein
MTAEKNQIGVWRFISASQKPLQPHPQSCLDRARAVFKIPNQVFQRKDAENEHEPWGQAPWLWPEAESSIADAAGDRRR